MRYTTPELKSIGSLAELTLGNSGSRLDGGTFNNNNTIDGNQGDSTTVPTSP